MSTEVIPKIMSSSNLRKASGGEEEAGSSVVGLSLPDRPSNGVVSQETHEGGDESKEDTRVYAVSVSL